MTTVESLNGTIGLHDAEAEAERLCRSLPEQWPVPSGLACTQVRTFAEVPARTLPCSVGSGAWSMAEQWRRGLASSPMSIQEMGSCGY